MNEWMIYFQCNWFITEYFDYTVLDFENSELKEINRHMQIF